MSDYLGIIDCMGFVVDRGFDSVDKGSIDSFGGSCTDCGAGEGF
jgi:hypothetical protein